MRKLFFTSLLALSTIAGFAQDKAPNPRPLTMDEYKKAKSFAVADLDKDTYVKFENAYVLDRYEGRKPYFITGSDGLKKRIDLYKLVAKEGMQEIGTVVFYTNETGKRYQAVVPDFTADGKVWEQYFQDIDDINKVEKNFILKLSYVLSKELSFQQYKVLNNGKDMKEESATYGNDICFPGDELVTMATGGKKQLKDVKAGDVIVTIDPATHQPASARVKELTVHAAKNYALTQLVVIQAEELSSQNGINISLQAKVLQATPNHPMQTKAGRVEIGRIEIGQQLICLNESTGKYEAYTVLSKNVTTGGTQPVYNLVAEKGETLLMNGVMVMQK